MEEGVKLKDALWADCETDDDKFNFLISGRGLETGLIARAIQHEVAMAFKFRSEVMKERNITKKWTRRKNNAGYFNVRSVD